MEETTVLERVNNTILFRNPGWNIELDSKDKTVNLVLMAEAMDCYFDKSDKWGEHQTILEFFLLVHPKDYSTRFLNTLRMNLPRDRETTKAINSREESLIMDVLCNGEVKPVNVTTEVSAMLDEPATPFIIGTFEGRKYYRFAKESDALDYAETAVKTSERLNRELSSDTEMKYKPVNIAGDLAIFWFEEQAI